MNQANKQVKVALAANKFKVLALAIIVVVLLASLMAAATLFNPALETTRVACLGDSITSGVSQDAIYPVYLQVLLGKNYTVGNFGVVGATALFSSDRPYFYTPAFQRARILTQTSSLLCLGTNDAGVYNYPKIGNFTTDYVQLIRQIQQFKSKPQIYIAIPPPILENNFRKRLQPG